MALVVAFIRSDLFSEHLNLLVGKFSRSLLFFGDSCSLILCRRSEVPCVGIIQLFLGRIPESQSFLLLLQLVVHFARYRCAAVLLVYSFLIRPLCGLLHHLCSH